MEDCNPKRKRVVDDSESDSPESKVTRVHSESDFSSTESELTRVNSGEEGLNSDGYELVRSNSDESSIDSPGSREMQNNILDILEDTDNVAERDPSLQSLDFVIKSFEEEILAPGLDMVDPNIVSETEKVQPNLGYLLEASDDELGLPPTVTCIEEGKPETEDQGRVLPENLDYNGFMGFEDDMPNYESLGFGTGIFLDGGSDDNSDGGFVTLDGLFDYAEPADSLWRPESLQAM